MQFNEMVDLSGAKVFIVDDNFANIDVLRLYLEPEGYIVSFADTGEKALKLIPKIMPDVVLLDIMMVPMDGFEVCRTLKEKAETSDIPVIFISAIAEIEDLARSFKAGGVDYITKPLSRLEITTKIRTHLQARLLFLQCRQWHNSFNQLAGYLPVSFFSIDTECRITYANTCWQTLFGEVDSLNNTWLQAIHNEDQATLQNHWEQCKQQPQIPTRCEVRLDQGKNAGRSIRLTTMPLFKQDNIIGFLGIVEAL